MSAENRLEEFAGPQVGDSSTAFLTDKYEITMLQAALRAGNAHQKAVFELFARRLPKGRRYGVVGGVNRAVAAVRNFRFTSEQLALLSEDPLIGEDTIEYLRNYRFRGRIYGYPEGEVFFPLSPVLTVEASFADAVLLETVLLSILNYDSAVMAAASRMVNAANGIPLIEMGARRANEAAAVYASRAAYIAGFTVTSLLEAGLRYGIPTTGTSAHSFTLAFADEREAFRAQVAALGTDTTLLVDTYGIERGIRNAVEVAGPGLGGIRIDSGNFREEVPRARALLDELGAKHTRIVLSSDIDEYTLAEMNAAALPVDAVGAGTRVVTGSGAPTAEMVYKLVSREGDNGRMVPVHKNSEGKASRGGRKIAYRTYDGDGTITAERFGYGEHHELSGGVQELLVDGDFFASESLDTARRRHARTVASLPKSALSVHPGEPAFTAQEDDA
ncbi:nicotinate phosphoribosyltransferase [Dermabacteraceae bacterium TAE3-ERU27]|nr:nicotinate phosphoribosyltransferase [Dermabacteraceae bacterium TAE3-ERU27]